MVQTYLIHHFYSIYDVGNEQCSFRYLQIIFISSYTFYIENTIYRDNPPVSLTLTPSFTQGGLLSVQISNIYIGQNINIKANLFGPPMVDPTPVSHTIVIIIYMIILRIFLYPQSKLKRQNLICLNNLQGKFKYNYNIKENNHLLNVDGYYDYYFIFQVNC